MNKHSIINFLYLILTRNNHFFVPRACPRRVVVRAGGEVREAVGAEPAHELGAVADELVLVVAAVAVDVAQAQYLSRRIIGTSSREFPEEGRVRHRAGRESELHRQEHFLRIDHPQGQRRRQCPREGQQLLHAGGGIHGGVG